MDPASYFSGHPPRCIEGFVARPVQLPGVEFDGHASAPKFDDAKNGAVTDGTEHFNIVFALACRYRWANLGHDNEVLTLSPLELECAACRTTTPLLDTDVHGYDPETGNLLASIAPWDRERCSSAPSVNNIRSKRSCASNTRMTYSTRRSLSFPAGLRIDSAGSALSDAAQLVRSCWKSPTSSVREAASNGRHNSAVTPKRGFDYARKTCTAFAIAR